MSIFFFFNKTWIKLNEKENMTHAFKENHYTNTVHAISSDL